MNIISKKCECWCIMCTIPQNIVNGPGPWNGQQQRLSIGIYLLNFVSRIGTYSSCTKLVRAHSTHAQDTDTSSY